MVFHGCVKNCPSGNGSYFSCFSSSDLSVYGNGIIVLLLAYERYVMICRPFQYEKYTKQKHLFYAAITVLLSLITPLAVADGIYTIYNNEVQIQYGSGIVHDTSVLQIMQTRFQSLRLRL